MVRKWANAGFVLRPGDRHGHRYKSLPMSSVRTSGGLVRLRDYSALRASPLLGSPFRGDQRRLRDVVEPGLFVCRGFELSPTSNWRVRLALLGEFLKWVCRLRDSNPRPTVYKTVALPLC